ncbi:MAG: glycosyltransferase, partial [Patescibacteria group bacterium]|nr:glycosyltransferase [Patescibacteria group bacterium]
MSKKIFLVSRCAWTLFNFRAGLMRELVKNGNTVIGGGAAGDGFEPKIEALGVKFIGLPVDKKGINPRADVKLFWTLYRWYKVQQPDIVHHFTIKPVIYGSIAARMAKIPKI